MTDVELRDLRDRCDWDHIVEGEAVAGMGFDAVLDRQRGAVGEPFQLGGAFLALNMGIAPRVELDDRRAEPHRGFDLAFGWLDEQADADTGSTELVDIISERVVLAGVVEAALGSS